MVLMFDVVVIGGNLSGATAAINAARMGVNVVLVEKNKEPYFPARCGEATDEVTANILDLDNIGCPKNEIKQLTINISSKKEYNFKVQKHKVYIIDRNFVEKYLLKSAKEEGVELKLGQRMKTFNPPNEIILDNKERIKGITSNRIRINKTYLLKTHFTFIKSKLFLFLIKRFLFYKLCSKRLVPICEHSQK